MSELKILDEFMQRVQYDIGKILRPCDYFHSITGVGASGVVAILLGVLGATIEETSGAFLELYTQVFPQREITPEARSDLLVDATKKLLRDFGVPEDCKLRGDLDKAAGCKVYVDLLCFDPWSYSEVCQVCRIHVSCGYHQLSNAKEL